MEKHLQTIFDFIQKSKIPTSNAKKALLEAISLQEKEIKIEASLEKIRSRTMQMQQSSELSEVSNMLYQQMDLLGVQAFSAGYSIWDDPKKDSATFWMSSQGNLQPPFTASLNLDPIFSRYKEASEEGLQFYSANYKGKNLANHYKNIFALPDVQAMIDGANGENIEIPTIPSSQVNHVVYFKHGFLLCTTYEPISEVQVLFKRFAKVFEQTYTRFLDLQKAEEQAREAQIEAALERVRAKALAMQSSKDLIKVATILREQMKFLGQSQLEASVIHLYKTKSKTFEAWYSYRPSSDLRSELIIDETIVTIENSEWAQEVIRKYNSPEKDYTIESSGKKLNEWYEDLKTVAPLTLDYDNKGNLIIPEKLYYHFSNFSGGSLMMVSNQLPNEEAKELQHRTAKVFDLAYKRFLDLQKAEAQAREAQIEAALERVRSRSMAMHKSEELNDVINTVFKELIQLDVQLDAVNFNTYSKDSQGMNSWVGTPNGNYAGKIHIPYFDLSPSKDIMDARDEGIDFIEIHCSKKEKDKWFEHAYKHTEMGLMPDDRKLFIKNGKYWAISCAISKHSAIQINSYSRKKFTEKENNIIKRFAKGFEQTYVRFLDLQKAEAQAREAQIEAALERVRSRSMAMQNSTELNLVLKTVFEELVFLEVALERCVIWIYNEDDRSVRWWAANPEVESGTESFLITYQDHPVYHEYWKAWEERRSKYFYLLEGENKNVWTNILFTKTELSRLPDEVKIGMMRPEKVHLYNTFNDFGVLFIASDAPISDDQFSIVERFGKVFDQSYTRFKDIQQAENRAKEAQIEAALERVRARSMGMQKSEELRDVIQVIYDQLIQLGFEIDGAGFAVDFRDSDDWNLWTADRLNPIPYNIHIPYFDHPLSNAIIEAKKTKQELLVVKLSFEEKNKFYEHFFKYISTPKKVQEVLFKVPGFVMSKILLEKVDLYIYNSTGLLYSDKENATLLRFGKVFEQTYVRFNDLKQAETQAKEAIKTASIDRVRAEIASMRSTTDLERITPLIWKELEILGVPFIRCGVFIMDEKRKMIQSHLSTPDGQSLAVFEMPFNTLETSTNMVLYWKKKEMYRDYMNKDEFFQFMQNLIDNGFIENMDSYQGTASPPESLHLNFLPFQQGMLYVGNTIPLTKDQMELIQSLTTTFSGAYARYEDFNQLEAAKKKVEKTLTNLKAAQKQLIQSEKMASLGELTAGIAHEIQNPLNFVNNFSEVSEELLEELEEEIENNSKEDIVEIISDLKQNLHKINHHGQRASGIVKGMLDHSRTSSGEKELTDMNVLADEYLRLSYHGLRAKDKSFNAAFETHFDENLPKVEVVPQDIGRVLLNLINNAFHACTERKSLNGTQLETAEDYKPLVTVSSKKKTKTIEISVKDNGNGIPKEIKDKIFQPFFTTKPTGQGTGLGLSLSYDIVKAHGGELTVKTEEHKGTEFTITLLTQS